MTSKKLVIRCLLKIFSVFIVVPFLVLDANAQLLSDNLNNGPGMNFTFQHALNLLRGVACWFGRAGVAIFVIMGIVYGIMFLLSRGNSGQWEGAKKALGWGIVGGLVIMGVFTIILSVAEIIGADYSWIIGICD